MKKLLSFITSAMVLFSPLASAHSGHAGGHNFTSGLLHPLTGLDHFSVMVGVGVLACILGGASRKIMPLSFIALMIVGAILGVAGVVAPGVETFIALSVVMMGAMLIFNRKLSNPVATGLIMAFALFHGMAHGVEMPANGAALSYFCGFVLATAGLHLCGLVLGEVALRLTAARRQSGQQAA